jgi:hypothetical protein
MCSLKNKEEVKKAEKAKASIKAKGAEKAKVESGKWPNVRQYLSSQEVNPTHHTRTLQHWRLAQPNSSNDGSPMKTSQQ